MALVQVIGGGQYRCACDHIHECQLNAVKHDTLTRSVVAPATPETLPMFFAANPPAAPAVSVAHATPQPAASAVTINTPCKSPAVPWRPQMLSTGGH